MTFEEIDELAIALAEKLRSGGCLGLIGELGRLRLLKKFVNVIILRKM